MGSLGLPATSTVALPAASGRRSAVVTSARFLAALLALSGAVALALSVRLPYWRMRLQAPQYPQGLEIRVFLDGLEGDVDEVDTLNHYIGVGKLGSAAQLERKLGVPATLAVAGALAATALSRRRAFGLLALPALAFPLGFVFDLSFWMDQLSTKLDPTAPIRMKPFSFALSGTTKVAQFSSHTSFDRGFELAAAAAAAALVALVVRETLGKERRP